MASEVFSAKERNVSNAANAVRPSVVKPYKSAKGFQSITGINYNAATERKINARMSQLEGVSGDVRTHSGYRVETVRNALAARLNEIRKLNRR